MTEILEGIAYLTITSNWVPLFPYQGRDDIQDHQMIAEVAAGLAEVWVMSCCSKFLKACQRKVCQRVLVGGREKDAATPDVS